MKSETRLDSAVFQLTPTRTRFDLVITANGKTEKIASGLLNPFVAHLKKAQDEIAKGGYSIILEPNPGTDMAWFTKGTVERFVRFVSTPEVLERVNTIESEILQIDEAIAIQGNDNTGLSTVENLPKSTEGIEGSKPVFDTDAEKAIVLFKPGVPPPESNGSAVQEEKSKVKLLRVLETRKTVLQKEQGMAFARAVAAGFDMDRMTHLISFAECFGASRLMDACLSFMELWKRKHETGQWLEIEAAEAMSSRSDFSSMNASGIMLSSETKHCLHPELGTESNGKTSIDTGAGISSQHLSSDHNRDKRSPMDSQVPLSSQEYFQGQFHHPMYPQWPIHSPPGVPVFPAYPMQSMPYYQNYPACAPFFQPPYPQSGDPRVNTTQRTVQKRHSMDCKDTDGESETWEIGVSNSRSQHGADQSMSDVEKEVSHGQESREKVGRSGRKQRGTVFIRNINYIASKRQNASGCESESASEPETDDEAKYLQSDAPERKHKSSLRSSKSNGSVTKSSDTLDANDDVVYGREADGGNWQAFQNFLLRDDEETTRTVERGMFSVDKDTHVKRRQRMGADPILPPERDLGEVPGHRMSEFDSVSGRTTRMYKQKASNDELAISREGFYSSDVRGLKGRQVDVPFTEIESGGGGYKRMTSDDFMIYGRRNQSGISNSLSDPLAGEQYGHADKLDKSSSNNLIDESFIVPFRSSLENQSGTNSRTAIDMDSEVPSARADDSSNRIRSQISYEPDDLSLVPERGTKRESIGYDPAVEYETHLRAVVVENGNGDVVAGVKEGSKKLDKEKKLRVQNGWEKRKMEAAIKKGKPSKLSPLAEAQARAEKLRAFKADLQKVKREKEEEQIKRLEALKRERQKRIAAKSSSNVTQLPTPTAQTKSRLPTKLSPTSLKGSKFSDSEPGSSSPIQKLPVKTALRSNHSQRSTISSRLNGAHLAGNGLSRSVSSLPERGVTSEPRAPSIRTRRLSDPKGSTTHRSSSLKSGTNDPAPKPKLSDEPTIKKISAIMSLDRTKSATLPELKIRPSRGSSEMVHNKSVAKEIMQKGIEIRTSLTSEIIKPKNCNGKTSNHSDGDENPVIEKTVVMLEREPVPILQASKEGMEIKRGSYVDVAGEKTEMGLEFAAIRAPASSITICEVNQDPNECQLAEEPRSHEVTIDHAKEELLKFSSNRATEKSYQAPYAQSSFLEDPCTRNLEKSKVPIVSSEMVTNTETVKVHASDFTNPKSQEQFPETLEKSRVKESSKGFKRLLKFRRKNHSSAAGEQSMDSDKAGINSSAVDGRTATRASSMEVHTLKNLISQDDSPVGGTPPKVSRPFSLMSPFRSKTSEKKLTT
ncbi:COP1-interacting protein 7-like isoform X2 [Tasmannia lanceolata]|uniref:COP1-interacting protein 7-like isoform X2 n=1 Tax=Tasmannia lanceolata TaxID=3420 RepID=UPI0040629DDE